MAFGSVIGPPAQTIVMDYVIVLRNSSERNGTTESIADFKIYNQRKGRLLSENNGAFRVNRAQKFEFSTFARVKQDFENVFVQH